MKVIALKFENYRNLKDNIITPCDGVNIIYGDNAQGKTNLLEALWFFCGGHSFRGSKDSEIINWDENFARIEMRFLGQEREQTAKILFRGGKKSVEINGVQKNSAAALIERFCAVVFSPEHLSLIKRGPGERRKFIDSAICREKLKNAVVVHVRSSCDGERPVFPREPGPFRKFVPLHAQQVAFRLNGGGATHAGGGNGLAVVGVRHVARGEKARRPGGHEAGFPDDVAGLVPIHQITQERGVRRMADGHEYAFDGQFRFLSGDEIFQHDGFQFPLVVRLVSCDGGIPERKNLFVRQRAFRHDFGGPEGIAAVNQINLAANL